MLINMIGTLESGLKFRVMDYDSEADTAWCVCIDDPDTDFFLNGPHDFIEAPEYKRSQ